MPYPATSITALVCELLRDVYDTMPDIAAPARSWAQWQMRKAAAYELLAVVSATAADRARVVAFVARSRARAAHGAKVAGRG